MPGMLWRLFLFSIAVGGYAYLRAIHPLRWRWWWKALAGAAVGITTLRLCALELLGAHSTGAALLPRWVSIAYSWLHIALLMWFCALFAGQLVRSVALRRAEARDAAALQHVFNRLHLGLLLLSLAASAAGTWGGLAEPRINRVSLACEIARPLRIALLADLHVSPLKPADRLQAIVERTNALGADVVCIVGDFVDGDEQQCGERMSALRRLRAPMGVYGVPGNHDYYSGYDVWGRLLPQLGVRMLHNAHTTLPGGIATLAGVTEQTAEQLPGMEAPNLEKALRGAPKDTPIILLSHRPGTVQEAAQRGVAVQLSGHTHGGLVWGIGQLVALMNDGYLAGLYQEGGALLYVSPGTDTGARTPLRLGVPAEITLLTLEPRHPQPPPGR